MVNYEKLVGGMGIFFLSACFLWVFWVLFICSHPETLTEGLED